MMNTMMRTFSKYLKPAIISVMAVCFFAGPVIASAADQKVGVVNIARIISEAPQAKTARAAMDAAFSARRKSLEAEQTKLREDAERIKRDADVVSEDESKRMREDWLKRQREHTQKMAQYNQDVQAKEKAELQKLRDSIVTIVEGVAKERGFDLVLSDGVVYASDPVNLTDIVLAKLKTQ